MVRVIECNIYQIVMKRFDKPPRGLRPNHAIQWLCDERWEPIFSLYSVKGIRTTLSGQRKGVSYIKPKQQDI